MMHLEAGSGEQLANTHRLEIEQAKETLKSCNKPIILCGDFNEDRRMPSIAYEALTETFVDCLAEDKEITCTDELWKKDTGRKGLLRS